MSLLVEGQPMNEKHMHHHLVNLWESSRTYPNSSFELGGFLFDVTQ